MSITLVPAVAHAQFGFGGIVFDPRNLAQSILLYQRAYTQLMVTRAQLQAQATALQKLRNPNWRDVGLLMQQVDQLTQQGNALAYSLSNIDVQFQHTFPGVTPFGTYLTQQARLTTAETRTLATMRGVLDAAGQTAQAFPTGVARLRRIKQQMGGIMGHEEALELANTVNAYSAEELMLLRQQIATETNAEAVYFANEVSERAQRSANERAIWSWLAQPAPAGHVISFHPGVAP